MQVKLIDFGMAGVLRSGRCLRGCLGSPGFIAPEVIRGDYHTVREAAACWFGDGKQWGGAASQPHPEQHIVNSVLPTHL
jgi:serine/threonine protein kinase